MTTHSLHPKSDYPNRAARLRLAARMAEEAALFGGRLRERRKELKLTQRELADRLPGKTEGKDISRYESGRHLPGQDTRVALAAALETTLADLYSGPEADRPAPGPAPDVLDALSPSAPNAAQLDRIEEKLDLLLEALSDQLGADAARRAASLALSPSSEENPGAGRRQAR